MKGTSVRVGSNTGCIQLPEGLSELFPPLALRLPWQVPRPGWESTEELPCRYTQLWRSPHPSGTQSQHPPSSKGKWSA